MDNGKFESNASGPFDITYNEDRTVMTIHGPSEHGGVLTRIAMYDDDNRPARRPFSTHGVLMELDAMNNIIFEKKVRLHWYEDEAYSALRDIKRNIS